MHRAEWASHMRTEANDLPRIVLTVLFLGLLLASVFRVLQPFLGAILWAAMIVVATWPVMRWLEHALGGRRWLAVTILTLSVLLVFVVPLFLAIGTLLANTNRIAAWAQGIFAAGLPPAPAWVAGVPVVGARMVDVWNGLANSPLGDLAARLTPYVGELTVWFGGQVGGLGKLLVQFLFTVALSAVFWSSGEAWGGGLVRFAGRLLGSDQGEAVVRLAGQAVRGVAIGVVGTALIQAIVGGIGLAIAGLPLATLLTVVMFLLGIAQIGPLPVLLSAVAWLFWSESSGMGAFLLVWSLVVGTLDNVVRPILIRKGANLPLLLVFAGVLGGLISFGLIGLFVGPVVLAVANTLLRAWMEATPSDQAAGVR
jgi:predicted PurR-regulated permease PerM